MNFKDLFTSVYTDVPPKQPGSARPIRPERHAISHNHPRGSVIRRTCISGGVMGWIAAAARRYALGPKATASPQESVCLAPGAGDGGVFPVPGITCLCLSG